MPRPKYDDEIEVFERQLTDRYRLRVVQPAAGATAATERKLDIREWLEAGKFVGFTRKGIRLSAEQSRELAAILAELLKTGVL